MSVTPYPTAVVPFAAVTATPLTTIFTPPSSCIDPEVYPAWATYTSCNPFSNFETYQFSSKLWYSPGVCPHNYNYVATSVQTFGGSITLAVCCPPYMDAWSGTASWYCYHDLVSTDSTGFFAPVWSTYAQESSSTAVTSRSVTAAPVSVAWHESDLPLFTPSGGPVRDLERLGVIAASTVTSTSAASANPHTKSTSPCSGLSAGAAAGIGVGATLAGAIIIAAGIWILKGRFEIKRRSLAGEVGEIPSNSGGKSFPPSNRANLEGASDRYQHVEESNRARSELAGYSHQT